jgi:hypothetical protein
MPNLRPNPELMVIGDSLPQGCRSLTVTSDFCAQSWPARLAAAQGWDFVTPDLPRPILFDLETEILDILKPHLSFDLADQLKLQGFVGRFNKNLADWVSNQRESKFDCFDNIAVAGDLISDLYQQSATNSQGTIDGITSDGATLINVAKEKKIPDLHIAINARFVLNPSQDPAFADFTQMDWVRKRLPKRLIVQIGHNHGLYSVGEDAVVPDAGVTGPDTSGILYFDQWTELAKQLAALPGDVKQIVICLLPKVGAVANLRPVSAERTDGYATAYEPVFSIDPNTLNGPELANVDKSIRDANATMQDIMNTAAAATGTTGRMKFISIYDIFDKLDFKNTLDSSKRVTIPGRPKIDNFYVHRTGLFHGFQLVAGGFENLDGMHASGAGYSLLACKIMDQLGLDHDEGAIVSDAFDSDKVLTTQTPNVNVLVAVLEALRSTQAHLGINLTDAIANDQFGIGHLVKLARSIFRPQPASTS